MQKNKQFGFSLIELLVSIAILGILAGMVLTAFYSTRKQQSLLLASQQVANDLNAQETKALNGVKDNETEFAWHGIQFQGGGQYNLCYYPGGASDPGLNGGCTILKVSKRLPGGLIFNASGTVVFEPNPPVLRVYNNGSVGSFFVTVSDPAGAPAKTINIDSNGRIWL